MKPIMASSLALLALAFSGVAGASALVDERSHVAASPSAASSNAAGVQAPGLATGAITGAVWGTPAPAPKTSETLSTALMELRPEQLPVVELQAPSSALLDLPVTWTVPSTRAAAVTEIAARYGVNLVISDASIEISRPAQIPAPQAAPAVPQVTAVASAGQPPAPPPKRAFEVRLSDVKLATAFDRWARANNVSVRWDADKHVLVEAQMTFMATDVFDAISQALATPGIQDSEYPLEVCEYPNTPLLLRVTRQGEQIKDCPN